MSCQDVPAERRLICHTAQELCQLRPRQECVVRRIGSVENRPELRRYIHAEGAEEPSGTPLTKRFSNFATLQDRGLEAAGEAFERGCDPDRPGADDEDPLSHGG